jgi:hypothetical protein
MILYPKIGDTTNLRDDSQKVLDRFGDDFQKFSISRYIWNKIHDTSEDPMKSLPYAPYIMHVIEQVSSIGFPTDAQYKLLKLANKMFISAARELKRAAEIAKGRGKVFRPLVHVVVVLLLPAPLVPNHSLLPPLTRARSLASSSFS